MARIPVALAFLLLLGALSAQPASAQLMLCPGIGGADIEITSVEEFNAAVNCLREDLQGPDGGAIIRGLFEQILEELRSPAAGGEPTECSSAATVPDNLGSSEEILDVVACAAEFAISSGEADALAAAIAQALADQLVAPPDGPRQVIPPCAQKTVHAAAIRTRQDVVAFANCAFEYVLEHGTAEAARAFREDARWRSGQFYIFVDELGKSGGENRAIVYPPDPSREGQPWGPLVDDFGTDLLDEFNRVMEAAGRGWVYYDFPNPETGLSEPKASYSFALEWAGKHAALGAGIYEPHTPGTCHAEQVNAAALEAAPTDVNLEAFVRCAADLLSRQGYFASPSFASDARWRSGSIYVFGLDPHSGAQYFSGNPLLVNGAPVPELPDSLDPTGQFGGRDILGTASAFGDVYLTYEAFNPLTARAQTKVSYLQSLSVQGIPLLVGAGLYLSPPPQ